MARNLYRFYLYTVFLAMLIFAAVGLGTLVQPLLTLTALRGTYSSPPSSQDLVQHGVFFAVSWLIAGVLGGLHYWLIRRDMQHDAEAGDSGIRAFFLNIAELIAAPLGIGFASLGVIAQLGSLYAGDLSFIAAFSLATLALFLVLELERIRKPATGGVALFFQRLHLYGVQFVLLNILVAAWTNAFTVLVNLVAFGGQGYGGTVCAGFVACDGPNVLSVIAAALWMVIFWLGYGFIARGDSPSLFRRILHYISFAYGVGLFLYGIYSAIALGLRNFYNVAPSAADILSTYNFTAYLTLGLLVAGIYLFWLRSAAGSDTVALTTISLICQGVIAALMAGAFFWGAGYAFLNIMEMPAAAQDWAAAVALLITGATYVALDVQLHRRKLENAPGAIDARRGFVFSLLGGGILAAAIGGAVALYAVITASLGSPLNDWQHTARIGLAAFIVGALVLGVYLWLANREQLFTGLIKRPAPPVVAPPSLEQAAPAPPTIEAVLDELLAGKITRDEAASRIRERK